MNEHTVAGDVAAVQALTLLREARTSGMPDTARAARRAMPLTVPTKPAYVRPNTPGPLATARQEAEARIRELQRQPASMQRDSKIRAERDFVALADVELAAGGA